MLAVVPQAAQDLAVQVQQAALIDLDATIFVQGFLFVALMLLLPRIIFRPMLERIEQRESRTEGARAEAKVMRHAADEQAAAFEQAMADEKRRALAERAEVRAHAQHQADAAIARARIDTSARIDAGIAQQRAQAARDRQSLAREANVIAQQVVDRLAPG